MEANVDGFPYLCLINEGNPDIPLLNFAHLLPPELECVSIDIKVYFYEKHYILIILKKKFISKEKYIK